MKTMSASITIRRPVGEVFAAATDFEHLPKWRSGLIEAAITSQGSVRAGSAYRFNLKSMGRVLETIGEIESYDPPGLYAWRATSGPFPMSGSIQCEAVPEGTRLTDVLVADPGGFFKLAEPLIMMQQQGQMEKDLHQLKDLLEARGNL